MFNQNIDFSHPIKMTPWRKIALGTWRTCGDPTIYALIEVDARPLLKIIEEYKSRSVELTPTILVSKALAKAFESYPKLNSMIRMGKLYQRRNIDLFLQVATNNMENLSGVKIESCDKKTLSEMVHDLKSKSSRLKAGDDYEYKKVKGMFDFLPAPLVAILMKTISFIINDLNLWSPLLMTPKDSFGSAMISSVGMLGIETAFAPLVPYSRCPVLLTIGKMMDRPFVENGEIIIRPSFNIGVTVDHRLADGVALSKMLNVFLKYLQNPLDI